MGLQFTKLHLAFPRRQSQAALLVIRLTGVLLLYGFTRWLFYVVNFQNFNHLHLGELLQLMFWGIRYDLVAIAITNLPLILLSTIPFHFRYSDGYQKMLRYVFVIINSFILIFNLIDVIFFRYIAKRTTSEILAFFANSAENTGSLLLTFLYDFWYMLLLYFIIIWLLYKLANWFVGRNPAPVRQLRWYLTHFLIFLVFALTTIVFGRGGMQMKPISMIHAANRTENRNIPLLINSPFSIMQTISRPNLKHLTDFSETEAEALYNPVKQQFTINQYLNSVQLPKKPNIVIFILESFGRDYIGYYNSQRQGLTPFLDSLLNHSITFEGFANGKRSNEALPSILCSIPSLMDREFQATPFITNKLIGIGSVLKRQGYQTAFFHGGNNGTMHFDHFSHIAGFDRYFGRNEYGNDKDFDGRWGIFDEPYLQYFSKQLSTFQQPFAACLFTLSSHHPYQLPDAYKGRFTKATNEMEATFSYTDHALQRFFEAAQNTEWFRNTIFVITADHTPEKAQFSSYMDYWGLYGIPLAFYFPGLAEGVRTNAIAQHSDILPSIAALTGSDDTLVTFGRNLFDSGETPFAINYLSGIYQLIQNDTLAIFSGNKIIELYELSHDSKLKTNLINTRPEAGMAIGRRFNALRQQYNNRLIENKLTH